MLVDRSRPGRVMTAGARNAASPFAPAVRQGVGLLIGVAGATGAGKTHTALRLARGLAGGDDRKIAVIDTEAGRALHYACAPGEAPGPEAFDFRHAPLAAPFTPERYLALIEAADREGFAVIVIDSFSHEWAGEGGLCELHDEIQERMGGSDKVSIAAWKEPKLRHKRLVSRLLQVRAHLVICMRAEDKLRIERITDADGVATGKTRVVAPDTLPLAERWSPICERNFPYELTLSFVLTPVRPGVPFPLKLQGQHRALVPLDRELDEATGARLAAWAQGAPRVSGPRPAPVLPTEQNAAPEGLNSWSGLGSVAAGGGDAPSSPPPSSTFPGDFVMYGASRCDPAQPESLFMSSDADAREMKTFAKALRALAERAETDALKRAWFARNADNLLRIASASPALHAWVREAEPVAPLHHHAAQEGAPVDVEPGAGAPSQERSAR